MERKNTHYFCKWINNDEGHGYFNGNYIWNSKNNVFEIEGMKATAVEILIDKDKVFILMKRVNDKWRIALQPGEGGSIIPLHTELLIKSWSSYLKSMNGIISTPFSL